MFAFKKKYFLKKQSNKNIELSNVKKKNKFIIIYRNETKTEKITQLLQFRKKCKAKKIDFYISNNIKLATITKADGLYVSAYNKNLNLKRIKNSYSKIIGSAHTIKELNLKVLQGCTDILFSRLFQTSYKFKEGFLGVVKFNLLKISRKENIIPLGGIRLSNLNQLSIVKCNSLAILTEVKKKPAKIFSRLF